jgi:hypothetical protein
MVFCVAARIKITYIEPGKATPSVVYAKGGENLMELAHANNVELEGANS